MQKSHPLEAILFRNFWNSLLSLKKNAQTTLFQKLGATFFVSVLAPRGELQKNVTCTFFKNPNCDLAQLPMGY